MEKWGVKMDYNYPLDYTWSTEEILLSVVALYNAVEQAYEEGIDKKDFLDRTINLKMLLVQKVKKNN